MNIILNHKMNKYSFFLLFLISSFSATAEDIHFSADSMKGTAGSKTDSTVLSGDASVSTSTMEIKADSIELSGEDFRYITAEGNVEGSLTESQMDFTCGKIFYDRKTEIARLEDSVHLVDKANDVTADAQYIEYNQKKEFAIMQIEITLKQKNNTCTSAFAIYKKSEQILEMSGNPKIVQGEDSFRAQEITLNLESQEITLDGRVRGTVTDTKKQEQTDQNEQNTAESPAPENNNIGEIDSSENNSPPADDNLPQEIKER